MTRAIPDGLFDAVNRLVRASVQEGANASALGAAKALRLSLSKAERTARSAGDTASADALAVQLRTVADVLGLVDGPTHRARRKAPGDPIKVLVDAGKLDKVHAEAAAEIAEIVEALDGIMGVQPNNLDPERRSTSGGGRFVQPVERLPERLQRRMAKGYRVWSEWAARHTAAPERARREDSSVTRASLYQLVVDVAVYNNGIGAWDRAMQARSGTAAIRLRRALDEYCYLVGWARRPRRPDVAETAARLGVTAEDLEALHAEARAQGASPDDVDVAIGRLTRRVEDRVPAAMRALAAMGVAESALKALGPIARLQCVAEQLRARGFDEDLDALAREATALEEAPPATLRTLGITAARLAALDNLAATTLVAQRLAALPGNRRAALVEALAGAAAVRLPHLFGPFAPIEESTDA